MTMCTKKGATSCRKAVKQKRCGKGVLNKVINNLSVELHFPGYQYCGLGTKLTRLLALGDPDINPLDKACTQREILGFTDQSFFVKIVFTKMLKFS